MTKTMKMWLKRSFQFLGGRMFTKMHFLTSDLDYFPQNCDDCSEERCERLHQDIRMMEERYQSSRLLGH